MDRLSAAMPREVEGLCESNFRMTKKKHLKGGPSSSFPALSGLALLCLFAVGSINTMSPCNANPIPIFLLAYVRASVSLTLFSLLLVDGIFNVMRTFFFFCKNG